MKWDLIEVKTAWGIKLITTKKHHKKRQDEVIVKNTACLFDCISKAIKMMKLC